MLKEKTSSLEISLVSMRPTVEVHLEDGRVLRGPRNASVGDFLNTLPEAQDPPIVGAIVNNVLKELTCPITMDAKVRPITMGEPDGMRIYRRSLVFLLEAAFDEIFPGAILSVDHSVASGGYYCQVLGRPPLAQSELADLEANMWDLVDQNLQFNRKEVPLAEAIDYFTSEGEYDKVRLMSHRKKDYLTLYQLGEKLDYHHGYMLPSTGYIRWFQLDVTGEGFTLRFPRRQSPTKLLPLPEYTKLLHTFRQYRNWLNRLDIESVGALNDSIIDESVHEVVLVSEALHELRVTEIASHIVQQRELIRVVMVAGPSASGKTTFSKRLSIQLLSQGISPFALAMDNYFVDRELTPRNALGELDFESIKALDCDRMSDDVHNLLAGAQVLIPHFNFVSGKQETGNQVQLRNNEIIILEGIHGLNPGLKLGFPPEQTLRIYASALTQLNLDRHNRVSTTDTRLIRRIVRDARERGYSAYQTIQRWESVGIGEKRYIFPYQENADIMFNSALVYELAALKTFAEPLLRQVPYGTREYIEAKRLLAFLDWFLPLDSKLIPDNSILREFIGSSILHDFNLWQSTK